MRKILFLVLGVLLMSSSVCYSAEQYRITINREYVYLDTQPQQGKSDCMLPLLEISDAIDVDVEWDKKTNNITIYKTNGSKLLGNQTKTILKMRAFNKVYTINDKERCFDTAPTVVGDAIMMPVKAICECFNYSASYNTKADAVVLEENREGVLKAKLDYDIVSLNSSFTNFIKPIYNIDGDVYVSLEELAYKMRWPIVVNSDKLGGKIDVRTNERMVETKGKTEFIEDGVLPDEDTALRVGTIILERYASRPLVYDDENGKFYLQVEAVGENYWRVKQNCERRVPLKVFGNGIYGPNVLLSKNTGEVVSISTEPYEDILMVK